MTVLRFFMKNSKEKTWYRRVFLENRGFLTKYGHESKSLILEKKKTWDRRVFERMFFDKIWA